MKKLIFIFAMNLIFALAVNPIWADEEKKAPGDYKMALILPGFINDQAWNATNYSGLLKSNEALGTKMEYIENVQAVDYEQAFHNYAAGGYDLIIAAGTQFDEAANKVAADYPDTIFCVINGGIAKVSNVALIFPKEYEASYLAAIIAGEISPKGQFGSIGGFSGDSMEKLLDVYEKVAVEAAKARGLEKAKAIRAYANNWNNPALGRQMAENMIDNGIDTLFVYANKLGNGSIQAAKEHEIKFIGFFSDQNDIAPDTVAASIVFDFETLYIWIVKKFMEGTLSGNTVHQAGVNEGIFKVVYGPSISQQVKDKVDAGIAKVKASSVDFNAMFTDNASY